MAEHQMYPDGSYVTVRGFAEGWQAVLAVRGRVVYRSAIADRTQAFQLAEEVAERVALPCLVRRVA